MTTEEILLVLDGVSEGASRAVAQVRTELSTLKEGQTVELTLQADRLKAELEVIRANLLELSKKKYTAEVKAKIADAIAKVEEFSVIADRATRSRTFNPRVHTSILGDMRRIEQGVLSITRDVAKFGEEGGNAGKALEEALGGPLSSVSQGLGHLQPLVQGAAIAIGVALVGAIGALAGGILGAIGAIGAFAAALAGMLGPILIVGIALFARFQKVMQAYQAAQTSQTNSMKANTTAEQRSAQLEQQRIQRAEAVKNALVAITTTNRNYAEAVRVAAKAIQDAHHSEQQAIVAVANAAQHLRDTTLEAYRAMQDAALAARDAVLSLADSELSVQEAKLGVSDAALALQNFAKQSGIAGKAFQEFFKKFADVNFDQSALAKLLPTFFQKQPMTADQQNQFQHLVLALARAKLTEKQATDQLMHSEVTLDRARQDNNKFIQQGINAYRPYTDAIQALKNAEYQLAQATQLRQRLDAQGVQGAPAVISAADAIRRAEQQLTDARRKQLQPQALDTAAKSADLAAQKYGQLTAAEKRFFDAMGRTLKFMQSFFGPATDAIFGGIASALDSLPSALGPLRGAFSALGAAIGQAFGVFISFLSTPAIQTQLRYLTNQAVRLVDVLASQVFIQFAIWVLNIAQVAAPLLIEVLSQLAKWLGYVARATQSFQGIDAINKMAQDFALIAQFLGAVFDLIFPFIRATAPAFQEIAQFLTQIVNRWAAWLNSRDGQAAMKKFFDDVLPMTETLLVLFGQVLLLFLTTFQALAPMIQPILQILQAVVGILQLFVDFLNVIPTPVRTIIGAFLGFGLVGKLLRLAGAVLGEMGPIISRIGGALSWIGRMAKTWIGWIFYAFKWVVDKIKSFLGIKSPSKTFMDIGISVAKGFINGVASLIGAAFNIAVKLVKWVIKGIKGDVQLVKKAGEWVIRHVIDGLAALGGALWDMGKWVWSRIVSGLHSLWNAMVGIGKWVIRSIVHGLTSAWRWLWNAGKWVLNTLKNAVLGGINIAINLVKGAGGALWDLAKGALGLVVPGLMAGGIVTSPGMFAVGEGGAHEAVLPLTQMVLGSLAKQITDRMQVPDVSFGRPPARFAAAGAGGPGMVIEHQEVTLPTPPSNPTIDPRFAAAQFAAEMKRRGRGGRR